MKKKQLLWIIIFTLLFNFLPVYASTKTFDRNEMDNFGVNKNWKITDENKSNVMNTPAVDASEKIYDYAEVLTDDEEAEIKEHIDEFIEKNKMDLAIVISNYEYSSNFNNYCTSDLLDKKIDEFNEDYAEDFYDYNDFGMIFENNTGILLFRNVALDPCDNLMYYDMYTFGDAQLYFNDSRYDSILDGIYDDISNKRYVEGFIDFIDRTDNYINMGKPSDMDNYYVDDNGDLTYQKPPYSIPWGMCLSIAGVITLIIMLILIFRNRMVKKATTAEEYLDKSNIRITNRKDVFIGSHTTSYTVSSSSGSGGGGHSSSHGSSGGGHSSGGGRRG